MTKRKRKNQAQTDRVPREQVVAGRAAPHGDLANNLVHVFVDDQNLFWGIVNAERGIGYRIDFGKLLIAAARDAKGQARGVRSAYIAGVIPDDDSFWRIAKDQGFTVRRGYLGACNRSKQDDAYLITDLTSTLYEEEGPSTIVLVAGDADYVPPLKRALEKQWRAEVAFIEWGLAPAIEDVVHEIRKISAMDIEYEG